MWRLGNMARQRAGMDDKTDPFTLQSTGFGPQLRMFQDSHQETGVCFTDSARHREIVVTSRHRLTWRILASSAVIAFASAAFSEEIRVATFEPVGGDVRSPSGWQQFCHDWPSECVAADLPARDIVLDDQSWSTIVDVNASVNKSVTPMTDKDHYGRSEYWT